MADARAREELAAMMELQRELLERAAEAEVQEDVEALRPRLQTLIHDYERFLRLNPKNPDGYVAYSMLLGNDLLDERERAKALLLKANSLDPNLPLVKNQLGKYIAEEGKPLDALNYFVSAAQLEPEEPLYHLQVGQLLGAARDEFLKSGEWTIAQIDSAMQQAFAEAVRLRPDSLPYAYRYAESFYDLHEPPWDEALAHWQALEERATSPVEQQMMRLHQANVRLFQGELDLAEALLGEAVAEPLQSQQQSLLARLERLRNPPPESDGTDVPANPEAVAAATPTPAPAPLPVIPEFVPGEVAEMDGVNSAVVMELVENNEGESTADVAPTPDAEPGSEPVSTP